MNSVILTGRLTRNPELRYTPNTQIAVTHFSIAVDRPVSQGKEKQTDFPRITVFGRQAENCDKYLSKGLLVLVQGKIQTGSYKNKDGVMVYTTDVIADRVEFLEWKDKNANSGNRNDNENGRAYNGNNDSGASNDIPDSFQAIEEDIPF